MLRDVCQKRASLDRFLDLAAKSLCKSDVSRRSLVRHMSALNHAERKLHDEVMIPKSVIVLNSYLNLAPYLNFSMFRLVYLLRGKIHFCRYV